MKHRFRNYMRLGWEVVEVPRRNLYGYTPYSGYSYTEEKLGNQKHYRELCEWCGKNFKQGTWTATIHAFSGTDKPGIKRFAFKTPSHATLFRMKWLCDNDN